VGAVLGALAENRDIKGSDFCVRGIHAVASAAKDKMEHQDRMTN